MAEGFTLTEGAVKKLAALAHSTPTFSNAQPSGPPPSPLQQAGKFPYPMNKAFYKIVANSGGGAYTVQRQEETTSGSALALADLTDASDPEYDWAQNAFHPNGDATMAAGDYVQGWTVWAVGDWKLLILPLGAALPVGTADWDLLRWDAANTKWVPLPSNTASAYQVLQRKADSTVGFDEVHAL